MTIYGMKIDLVSGETLKSFDSLVSLSEDCMCREGDCLG